MHASVYAYITHAAVAEMVENSPFLQLYPPQCFKSARTFRHQRYFPFPWIERNAHHSARLFWVIRPMHLQPTMDTLFSSWGLSSGLIGWLYCEHYNTLKTIYVVVGRPVWRMYVVTQASSFHGEALTLSVNWLGRGTQKNMEKQKCKWWVKEMVSTQLHMCGALLHHHEYHDHWLNE